MESQTTTTTQTAVAREKESVSHKRRSSKKRLSRKEQKVRRRKQQKRHHEKTQETNDTTNTRTNSADESNLPAATVVPKESSPVDYLKNYVAIPVPQSAAVTTSESHQTKSLGKWFPKAVIVKKKQSPIQLSDDSAARCYSSLLLFYQYVSPAWSESKVKLLMTYLEQVAQTRTLGGRIRVAPEGVNATISSIDTNDNSAMTCLHALCQDLRNFDSVFDGTDFKFIPNLDSNRHFKDLKILPVKELVFYGLKNDSAPLHQGGTHVNPQQFHEMLGGEGQPQQDDDNHVDTVVIDVRNHYEAAIGRFDGQEQHHHPNAAQYMDPGMRKSTDFSTWLSKPSTQESLKDKRVLMFCTGGVRCERASAHLNHTMGSQLKGVYQLQGGIERYLQTYPNGGYWRGKNFVFDKREAISADNPNGDGGILIRDNSNNTVTETKCCLCQAPWDRYVGKQKCDTCGVPVLVCDQCCMSIGKNNKSNKMLANKKRCPLCVRENITVPVDHVQYTNNGVSCKNAAAEGGSAQAAPSVLKWGGGHATKKKKRRPKKTEAM